MVDIEVKMNPTGTVFGDMNRKLVDDLHHAITQYISLNEIEGTEYTQMIGGILSALTFVLVSVEENTDLLEGIAESYLKRQRKVYRDVLNR